MSSYQALYRVWRPQRFDEVVGQPMITQTLKNAIVAGTPAHAYLLTGPRGTGKTSVAKIFAKALNCPHSEDGEPCNTCEICEAVTEGSLGDVIEIDAASNNGVEEIRDIREKANYAPTRAQYKVYIIDEVHMLSIGAFNALLKTLEEPPTNVVFILATTEPHKIPLTIISRTQRFDFRRIDQQTILKRMEHILEETGVDYEPEALLHIAQTAEGGMRDALSLLDQVMSFSEGKVTTDAVREITGSLTQELMITYLKQLYAQEVEPALGTLHDTLAEGKDTKRFVMDMIMFCRDVLLARTSGDREVTYKLAQPTAEFQAFVQEVSAEFLYRVLNVFNHTQQELKLTNHGDVFLEVATIQLADTAPAPQATAAEQQGAVAISEQEAPAYDELTATQRQLERQLSRLEKRMSDLSEQSDTPQREEKKAPRSKQQQLKESPQAQSAVIPYRTEVFEILEAATRPDLTAIQELWPDFIHTLEVSQRAVMNTSAPVAASPDGIVLGFEYEILVQRAAEDDVLQRQLEEFLTSVGKEHVRLISLTNEQWQTLRQDFIRQMRQEKKGVQVEMTEAEERQLAEEEAEAEKEKAVVDQAVKLFGEDQVEVIEED